MNADPIVLKTGGIDQFFEDMTNKSMLTIVSELDAWCTNGLRGNLSLLIISRYILPNFYRTCNGKKELTGM